MKGNFNRENAAGAKKLCENATLTKFQESFHTSCIALLGLLKQPGMYPGTMMLDSLAKSLRKWQKSFNDNIVEMFALDKSTWQVPENLI